MDRSGRPAMRKRHEEVCLLMGRDSVSGAGREHRGEKRGFRPTEQAVMLSVKCLHLGMGGGSGKTLVPAL